MKCLETLTYYGNLGRATIDQKYLSSIRYIIKDPKKFSKLNKDDMQSAYWSEILQRSHWAAVSSIQRNLKWMDGISLALTNSNMLLFAAGLRGFIESCADSMTTLSFVPITLAQHFAAIRSSLNRTNRRSKFLIIPELEEILIHFAFAKGQSKEDKKNAEKSHIAKTNTEYIKVLDRNVVNGPVYQLYSFLCQFSHPASNTVFYSMNQTYEDLESEFRYVDGGDDKGIVDVIYRYDSAIADACQHSFNAAFVLLKTLNEFKQKEVFTPFADGFTFEDTKAWSQVKAKMASSVKGDTIY